MLFSHVMALVTIILRGNLANQVEGNIVRCPDPDAAQRMVDRIDAIRKTGDSIGGVVECVARNVPSGLGSPVFDKLEAELAKGCMSLPASKGFEVRVGVFRCDRI